MSQIYARPPAVAAVIEIRTAADVPADALRKVRVRLAKRLPVSEDLVNVSLSGVAGAPNMNVNQVPIGHRLVSGDGATTVLVRNNGLTVSRGAPYLGWEALAAEFEASWKTWARVVGRKPIAQIGVRFTNRLDIPWDSPRVVEETDYLNVGTPKPPFDHGHYQSFFSIFETTITDEAFKLILQVGVAEPQLVEHVALLLDIDVISRVDGSLSDTDLWERLGQMRLEKNRIFEACITDKARALFNA